MEITRINAIQNQRIYTRQAASSAPLIPGETKKETTGISVEISEKAKERYQALMTMKVQAENAAEQAEQAQEMASELGKILTIYRRIAAGDIVPPEDERKLMEHSFDLYQAAKAAAMMADKRDPEEYDSVDKDGEEKPAAEKKSGAELPTVPEVPAVPAEAEIPEEA